MKHEVIHEISKVEEESRIDAMSPSILSKRNSVLSQSPDTGSKQTEVEMVTLTEETKSRVPTQMEGSDSRTR